MCSVWLTYRHGDVTCRIHVIFVYFSTFLYDISGWKQYGRYDVSTCVDILGGKLGILL
jgi:hypothetical protein